ncbi:MAG: hypothetical protein ACOCQQ_00345 [Candidatus Nanoarchaeia archaeon]
MANSSFIVTCISCADVSTTNDPRVQEFLTLSCINEFDSTPLVNDSGVSLEDYSQPTSEELKKEYQQYVFDIEDNTQIIAPAPESRILQEETSSFTWVWFVTAGLILLIIFIFLIIKRVEHSENAYHQQKVQLQNYVWDLQKKGYSQEIIYKTLRKRGYSASQISSFFTCE